jgi:hypothetical protein
MALETDLNIDPYYNDFDEQKNFHRILFRPAVPVQARELSQLQDILQNQVERFGQNIYREGSIIKGCSLTFDDKYYYVKVLDLLADPVGLPADVTSYVNTFIVHDSSGLQAICVNAVTGLQSQTPDLNTLYIKYLSTGDSSGSEKKTFASTDVLTSYDQSYKLISIVVTSSGTGYNNTNLVSITGGDGTGAVANVVTYSNGSIRSITLSSQGSGYVSAPTIAITNSTGGSSGIGSGAAFTAKNYYAKLTAANSTFETGGATNVGRGYAAKVTEGVIFQKGHFVRVDPQEVIVEKYSPSPDQLVLGFATSESIVNNNSDSTLLDGAQGYSNYTAPGAHRLKLTANLVVKTVEDSRSEDGFFSVVEFENGRVTRERTKTAFNSVEYEMARRTDDITGDFSVIPFRVYTDDFIGAGNSSVNSASHITAAITSGLGYFSGHRVEVTDTIRLPIKKANTTRTDVDQTISLNYGSYVLVNEYLGNFDFEQAVTVDLQNKSSDGISVLAGGDPNNTGTKIGTARLRSIVYESGDIGTPECKYRAYLFDIKMQTGYSFSQVRSIYKSGAGSADVILEPTKAVSSFTRSFNASSDVSDVNETIGFSDAKAYFDLGDYVVYSVAAGNTAVSSLVNGTGYYINSVNSTHITLRTSPVGSTPVNLTAGTSESGHYLSSTKGPKEAVLKDPNFDAILFGTGTYAVSNVSSASYTFRGTIPTTISVAGIGQLDACTSYSAGITFPLGIGTTLNTSQENEFIIIPAANVYSTSNGAGSVSSYSGNVVTGSGTSFLTDFHVGDYVRFANTLPAANTTLRRITRIDSDTVLYLDNTGSPAISGANIAVAFPKNVPITLQNRTGASIQIDGTNQYQANVSIGLPLNSSVSANVICSLKVTTPGLTSKTLTANVYFKIDGAAISANPNGPWCLGFPDVQTIKAIYKGTGTSYNTSGTNYAQYFLLDDGQRDSHYGLASLKVNPTNPISLTGTDNLTVVCDVLTVATPGKFATTESYPIDDITTPLPSNKIRTQNIRVYKMKSGRYASLRDCVDFRPYVANTSTLATVIGNANTATEISKTETFSGDKFFPYPNSTMEADITSYLKRIDAICIDPLGVFDVVQGEPSNDPRPPLIPDTASRLFNIHVAEFPSLPAKEAYDSSGGQYATLFEDFQTKRYTMQDIKAIEKRIERLEYISLLNLLEKKSSEVLIRSELDPTLNRFKNGFFADGFDDYNLCDPLDPELNILIDFSQSKARPYVRETRIPLKFNSGTSTNIVKKGDHLFLNYTVQEPPFIEQAQATKFVNLAQDTYHYRGQLYLTPEFDNHYNLEQRFVQFDVGDGKALESVITTVNKIVQAGLVGSKDVKPLWTVQSGVNYGIGTVQQSVAKVHQPVLIGQTRRTNTWQQQTDTSIRYSYPEIKGTAKEDTQILGNVLNDLQLRPFIRAQKIYFQAVGLRPGARHYLFADEKDMSNYVRPMVIRGAGQTAGNPIETDSSGNPTNLTYSGVKGDPLIPTQIATQNLEDDENGVIYGEIEIGTENGNQFYAGEVQFRLVDVDNINSTDATTSEATSKFRAYSFEGTRSLITMKNDRYQFEGITENRGNFTRSSFTTFNTTRGCVPVAQTFRVDLSDAQSTIGAYLSKIVVYFKRKDNRFGVNVEVREVENGVPGRIVLGKVNLRPSNVNLADEDGTFTGTEVVFPQPIFLASGNEYALVFHPEGFSPEYLIWTGKAGQQNLRPQVTGEPYRNIVVNDWGTGSLFYSTNGTTWTPVQDEDLTFKLYLATFNASSGTARFDNGDLEFLKLENIQGSFTTGERIAQLNSDYLVGTVATSTTLNTNNCYTITGSGTNFTSGISPDEYALVVYAHTTADITGTVSVTSGTATVTGSGTSFTSDLDAGQWVVIANTYIRRVDSIANNTQLTLDGNISATVSGQKLSEMSVDYDVVKVVSRASATSLEIDTKPSRLTSSSTFANMQKVVSGVIAAQLTQPQNSITVDLSNAANDSFKFVSGNTVIGDSSLSLADINEVMNKKVHYLTPQIQYFTPTKTNISLYANVAGSSVSGSNTYYRIRELSRMDYEGLIKSKSNEISGTSITKSMTVSFPFSSTNELFTVSPRLDVRSMMIINENEINNDYTDEETRYGNATVKYISKKIELAEGQDSEDLQVFLTAYKPSGSDIKVYVRIQNPADPELFENKPWSELTLVNDNYVSTSLQETDLYEYKYTFQQTPPSQAYNTAVTTSANTTVTGTTAVLTYNFNSDTGVSNTNETIAISSADTKFSVGEKVTYLVQTGNTAVTGLTANSTYYIQFANSTHIKLTDKIGGSATNITSAGTGETGHSISGEDELAPGDLVKIVKSNTLTDFEVATVSTVASNGQDFKTVQDTTFNSAGLTLEKVTVPGAAYKYALNSGVVRYNSTAGGLFNTYKEFSIKVVLLSSDALKVPVLDDIRAIALSV